MWDVYLLNNLSTLDEYKIVEQISGISIPCLLAQRQIYIKNYQKIKIIKSINDFKNKSKPLAYIIAESYFYNYRFYVNKSVLIPRTETEWIVESALKYITENRIINPVILDLCTGSGCIGLSISKSLGDTPHSIFLSDISRKALKIATLNSHILLNNTERNNIHILKSNLFDSLSRLPKVDILVANPPYIPKSEISKLQENVKNYEPILALDGGTNGYSLTSVILKKAKLFLSKKYILLIEIDPLSAKPLLKISSTNFGKDTLSISKDFRGQDRYLKIESNDIYSYKEFNATLS